MEIIKAISRNVVELLVLNLILAPFMVLAFLREIAFLIAFHFVPWSVSGAPLHALVREFSVRLLRPAVCDTGLEAAMLGATTGVSK